MIVTRDSRLRLVTLAMALGACLVACGSKTAAAPPPAATPAPEVPLDKRVADLLRLEQMRVLQDPATKADLIALLGDSDETVRRRAAIGPSLK